jgi:hypothetical protein
MRCLIFEPGQGPAHESSWGVLLPPDDNDEDELHAATTMAAAGAIRARDNQARTAKSHATSRLRMLAMLLREMRPVVLALAAALATLGGCDRDGPLDTVADSTLDAAVWHDDAMKMLAVLPRVVTSFKPTEGAAPFNTSYRSGPVFGASCTYADGPRQLVVRFEGGNIRERFATLAQGHANAGEAFVTRDATVKGEKATVHWNGPGQTADVVYVLQRRFLVELRLVPARSDDEVVQLAEAMDVAPLGALALVGVK